MAATAALQGLLNYGEMLSYRSAMIIGAAGGVGHFAVQIAKNFDLQVTAVTREENIEFVRSIGADFVISSDNTDYIKSKNHYELIFDTIADKSARRFRKMLTRDGRYVACAFSPSAVVQSPFGGILNNRKIVTFDAKPNMDDLATIRKMIEKGNITPRVDKVFPLTEIKEAFSFYSSGKAKGKVVLTMDD
jgi:NADPH:quinone reductase-like Zn-dependent oxidoreductase